MAFTVGAVSYLNARPLIWSLRQAPPADVELVLDVPARLSERMAGGELAAGLIPVFEYLRGVGARVVPNVSLASRGPVASVKLFCRRPPHELTSVALDPASRTSQALTRIVLAERYDCRPEFFEHPADLDTMLQAAEAALLIGNASLTAAHPAVTHMIDLGEAWYEWQGKPFVFAVWALGGDTPPRIGRLLLEAKDAGLAAVEQVAEEAAAGSMLSADRLWRYFTENLDYDLTEDHIAGLDRFADLCIRHGLLDEGRELQFADVWGGIPS